MDGSLSRSRRRARSSRGPELTDSQKILKQGPKQRSLYALPGWQKSAVQTRAPSFLPARTPAARLVPPIQQPAHPAPGIPAWLLTDTRPSLLQANLPATRTRSSLTCRVVPPQPGARHHGSPRSSGKGCPHHGGNGSSSAHQQPQCTTSNRDVIEGT